jgi:hypothetical protein
MIPLRPITLITVSKWIKIREVIIATYLTTKSEFQKSILWTDNDLKTFVHLGVVWFKGYPQVVSGNQWKNGCHLFGLGISRF